MKKILVIEDEELLRLYIVTILQFEAFYIIEAKNGHQGVQFAQAHIPDLIICDVIMPEIDGYGVLAVLRQNPVTATIPFIFTTARASKADLRYAMELGADDYLTKPFTADELLSAIVTRLKKQAAIVQESEAKLEILRSNITLSLPHELQTPLNGILGFSELLRDEYKSIQPDEIREIAEAIRTSGQRLYRLVQNFLLYAQLQITATDPKKVQMLNTEQTYCPKSIIEEVALQKSKHEQREADLELDLINVTIKISENNFKKIVEELIDNAFKYSPVGTPIQIISSHNINVFIFSVVDRGRGMTAEQIHNVGAYMQFERKFYEQQGSGLGLLIAKHLAELHGGELAIESLPGEKTIVQVTLREFHLGEEIG